MPGQTQARDIAKAGDMAATLVLRQTSKSHVGRPLHRSAQESKAEGHVGEKVIPIQCRCAADGNICIGSIFFTPRNCQRQPVLHIWQFRRAMVRPTHTDERAAD